MTQFELWKIDTQNYMQSAVVFILAVTMMIINADKLVSLESKIAATSLLVYASTLVIRFAMDCKDLGFNYYLLWVSGMSMVLFTGLSIWY